MTTQLDLETLDFQKGGGLVTVIAQDALTGAPLMLAFADREALERTLATGEMHYSSRSRGLWHKGETSGNTQHVVSLTADCDRDSVLARVIPKGPSCHNGDASCWGALQAGELRTLDATIAARAAAPEPEGYTGALLADRNKRLKKLGEEAAELAVACADHDTPRAIAECADLIYHALVALRAAGGTLADVEAELRRRAAPTAG